PPSPALPGKLPLPSPPPLLLPTFVVPPSPVEVVPPPSPPPTPPVPSSSGLPAAPLDPVLVLSLVDPSPPDAAAASQSQAPNAEPSSLHTWYPLQSPLPAQLCDAPGTQARSSPLESPEQP